MNTATSINNSPVIPLENIWSMIHGLNTGCKLWLMSKLSSDIHAERDITQTRAYKEAMSDIEHGRVHTWDSVEELFNTLDAE